MACLQGHNCISVVFYLDRANCWKNNPSILVAYKKQERFICLHCSPCGSLGWGWCFPCHHLEKDSVIPVSYRVSEARNSASSHQTSKEADNMEKTYFLSSSSDPKWQNHLHSCAVSENWPCGLSMQRRLINVLSVRENRFDEHLSK